jgi:hypothetical protein
MSRRAAIYVVSSGYLASRYLVRLTLQLSPKPTACSMSERCRRKSRHSRELFPIGN